MNEEIADALILRFKDLSGIVGAGERAIMSIPAIGKARARKIINALK